MFLTIFIILLISLTFPDMTERYEVTTQSDYSLTESYFHEISLGSSGYSVIMVTNTAAISYTLTIYHCTFSSCSAHINTLFQLSNNLRIYFDQNCIFKTHCDVEGAVMQFSSIYNQAGGGSPHQFQDTSISQTTAGAYIMSFQDASAIALFEFKYNNVSFTTITASSIIPSDIGMIQFKTFHHDIFQNTLANNQLSRCGCIYLNHCTGDQNHIHECNFFENSIQDNWLIDLIYSDIILEDCYFLDNTANSDTLFFIFSGNAVISHNIYSEETLYSNNGGVVSQSNNMRGRTTLKLTHFETKFCYAQIPLKSSPKQFTAKYNQPQKMLIQQFLLRNHLRHPFGKL